MWWTVKDLAQRLQIKPSTLYMWAAQGKVPCRKIHGLVRFDPTEIDRWLASFAITPFAPTKTCLRRTDRSGLDQLIARAKREVYTPACEKPDEVRAKQGGL